ncbi:hypothetical protein ACFL27_20400 [candidate division CSSED10-310 bacterium]|uniref:SGNH/GDSL hydrolase family protein n=1 Tax=candidate division CSSED10-310 bacterium TaxID=2855610 RepID=A0ABV6Z280_UNCC1
MKFFKGCFFAIATCIAALILCLIVIESGLRLFQVKTFDEEALLRKRTLGPGGYLKAHFRGYIDDGYGGAAFWYNNAHGFRTLTQTSKKLQKGTLRILILTDFFLAGYRVDQEHIFSHHLEKWLNERFGEAEVLIAHIEEPVTGLYYLTKVGLKFQPHIVFLGITLANDIGQSYQNLHHQGKYIWHTPAEKISLELNQDQDLSTVLRTFDKYVISDECRVGRPASTSTSDTRNILFHSRLFSRLYNAFIDSQTWEEPQAIKNIASHDGKLKMFDACHGLGYFLREPPQIISEMYQKLFRILGAYKLFCDNNKITLAVIICPQRFQIQTADWQKTIAAYGLNEKCFDTMLPNRMIKSFCHDNEILCIDPSQTMIQRHEEFKLSLYCPKGDIYWNKTGHKIFADYLQQSMKQIINPHHQSIWQSE